MHLSDPAVGVAVGDACHRALAVVGTGDRTEHLGAAQQPKRRLLLGRGREQLEEIPLRHQRDVLVRAGDSTQVDPYLAALHGHRQGLDVAMRHLGELRPESEFVEQPQCAGVHGVAAEVTQKVGVLLHHRHVDACPREQQPQHDSGRATAGDDAGGVLRLARHAVIFASNSVAVWPASSIGGTASNCGSPGFRSSFRRPW
jgi:hypothetical protein